jgi:hypothetical protein
MWKDPIVEEIHAIRREISRECGDDLAKIMDRLRSHEAMSSGPLIDKDELRRRTAGVPPQGSLPQESAAELPAPTPLRPIARADR